MVQTSSSKTQSYSIFLPRQETLTLIKWPQSLLFILVLRAGCTNWYGRVSRVWQFKLFTKPSGWYGCCWQGRGCYRSCYILHRLELVFGPSPQIFGANVKFILTKIIIKKLIHIKTDLLRTYQNKTIKTYQT